MPSMTPPTPPQPQAGATEDAASQSPHHLEQQRRENRDAIAALGAKPYGSRTDGLSNLTAARAMYDESGDAKYQEASAQAKGTEQTALEILGGGDPRAMVKVAGRIVLKRDGGRLIWMQLRDHTTAGVSDLEKNEEGENGGGGGELNGKGIEADLQIAVSKKDCAEPGFDICKQLDLGDIVVVTGPLMKTKKGEITIWASGLEIASKSIAPPPEKWSGLQDIELRYRKRYVDLYANPESMHVMKMRAAIMNRVRSFLSDRGDFEVETPVLQSLAGGAAARPFVTHMNALDIDLFMRIAPELYHKRLIVGGLPGVFELSRNFRNEGMDKNHNPEFTSLEVYEAFGDYHSMRELTEEMIRACARCVVAKASGREESSVTPEELRLPFGDMTIDFGSHFRQVTFSELFESALGFPMTDESRVRAEAESRGLAAKYEKHLKEEGRRGGSGGVDVILLVNELFEEVAEPAIDPEKPTFVLDYPAALSPLTRPCEDNPNLAQRWDLFAGGMELGPAYTELNDPDIQEAKFREQLTGIDDEESTFRTFDKDFINALKVGMPPTGGMGLGLDRLCMLLLNQRTIRDVILFPMMKPEG